MGDSWSLRNWRWRRIIDNRVWTFVMRVKRAPVHLGDSSVSCLLCCGRMSCAFSTVSSGVNDGLWIDRLTASRVPLYRGVYDISL
jgi:hypothetical protein